MRLHRFYINQIVGNNTEITLSDPDLIHQLGNVFRLKSSDQVIVFDGSGFEYVSQIVSLNKKELVLNIVSKTEKKKSDRQVSLYLSLIKKSNFELAVEKCTEVGVDKICPLVSERSEKKDLNMERLHKIAKEASEQSGRTILPEIYPHLTLETAVSQAIRENEVCVVFHTQVSYFLAEKTMGKKIAIFVGPEGGWTEKELELFKKNNFQFSSLGQNVLRAETAAIVSSALFLIL